MTIAAVEPISKRRKKKIYIQTAGVIMLGLRTMRLYVRRKLEEEGIERCERHPPKKLTWWNRIFLHVTARYDWVCHSN